MNSVKRNKTRSSSSYWPLIIVIIILIGVAGAVYAGVVSSHNIKTSLAQRTESLAVLIPAQEITSLDGSDQDISSPTYQALKNRLTNVRNANNDIRFVYIMGLSDNGQDAFFYVDSEDPSSDDYSPPGQSYPEGLGDVQSIFETGQSQVLPIARDRWGVWLSSFSPIKTTDGEVVGMLGLDIPAKSYYMQVGLNASIPILLTGLIVSMVVWARRRAWLQQQFLAEKAFFLSFASHEIRSPLTSVAWALRRLISHERKGIQKESLEDIQKNLQHILYTLDDVLSLQGMERLQTKQLDKKPVAIHSIIQAATESLELMSREHRIGIKDLTASADKLIIGHVDELLFKRVIANLMVNSLKYSPKDSFVEVALSQTDNHWMVSIHNYGPGISPADQRKIFEGFYRTKQAEASKQKGTGFGLMLCRDIVLSHGGKLELESAKDLGVTFKIILPKK